MLEMELGAGADPHREQARRHGLRGFRSGGHNVSGVMQKNECDTVELAALFEQDRKEILNKVLSCAQKF